MCELRFYNTSEKADMVQSEEYKKWTRENYNWLQKNFKEIEKDMYDSENKDLDISQLDDSEKVIKEEYNEFDLENYREMKKQSFISKLKPIEKRVDYISFNKLILKSEDRQQRHTLESKAKLSIARRKRKKQPREGTSLKPKTLGDQLKRDYSSIFNKNKDAQSFIKNVKKYTNEEMKDLGIYTDYSTTSLTFIEIGVQQILYDPHQIDLSFSFEKDVDLKIDLDILLKNIEEEKVNLLKDNYSQEFIDLYENTKIKLFELNYKYNFQNHIPEIKNMLYRDLEYDIADDLISNGVLDF